MMSQAEYLALVSRAQVTEAKALQDARAVYHAAAERARVEYNRAVMAAFDAYAAPDEPSGCPVCGASGDEPCVSRRSGRLYGWPHAARGASSS